MTDHPAGRAALLLVALALTFAVAFGVGRLVDPADRGIAPMAPTMTMTP